MATAATVRDVTWRRSSIQHPVVAELIPAAFARVQTAGLSSGMWRARNVAAEAGGMRFEAVFDDEPVGKFRIPLAGEFNVRNALGVLAVARELEIPVDAVQRAFGTFRSVKRRLEVKGEARGVTVYDDFAHHPTAVRETLIAVRQRHPTDRIWAVFEPRSNTCRRRVFETAFIESFDAADEVAIARVFGASMLPAEERLSPERVVEGVRQRGKAARSFDTAAEIAAYVGANAKRGDRVVVMSNGGFDGIHAKLLTALK
jgi:UDP-N-acetylmuramate: L-alanyl-gamma-D-glutamyl-meso-diaminopimelate ligase